MTITCFEDLEIWQEPRELCKVIRKFTIRGSCNQDFRFRDQINASAGSVMDNIAEGFERDGNKEFCQFLSVSKGSCGETRTQCYRAFDCEYISQIELDELLDMTHRLGNKIGNFMNYLKNSPLKGSKFK